MATLADLRKQWETGTTVVEYVAEQTRAHTVVTRHGAGNPRFNVYRYFQIDEQWNVSVDRDNVPVEQAMLYLLNHPAKA